jgi:tripartite-type tricarboxylate transporter receptor subunit TctC
MSLAHHMHVATRAFVLLIALQFVLIGDAGNAEAQDVFYAGKTLKVIVGFPPGGAYDLYSRALAKFLPHHIPGEPNVIVVNMPGAGSLLAANYIFNLAPRDGTEIGSVETFIPFEAFYNGNAVRFDPLKFSWIGALNSEMTACVVWQASRIKTFSDLLTTEAPFGATGSGAPPVVEPKVMNAVLGTKIRLVTGYPGTADIFIAMENGEVDGTCGVGWTTLTSTRGDWITQGKLRLLVQNAVKRDARALQTPLLLDFAESKEQKELLTLLAAPHRIGRPYLAPPGMPAGRLETLRRAFEATTKDPAFIAETKMLKLDLNPVTGNEMEAVFTEVSGMDRSLIEKMIDARKDE